MRISSNQMFTRGLNNMLKQQADTLRIQQQLSSGKRVLSPSDDPIAAAKIDLMNQRIFFGERLEQNRQNADGALKQEESVIGNMAGVVQKLRELQVQAGNGSLTDSARKALADEAQNLLDQLQGLANTQDSNGYYMFSGSRSEAQTISRDMNGEYVYNGDQTQRFQAISSGLQVALNDTGDDLFMRVPSGNGLFTVSETATPNTGTAVASSGSVVNNAAYVADDYTIQFALNTQNQLVVMVSGVASGNVVPATGLPDDAPLYTDGMAVSFNGIEINITGTPEAGDAFAVAPAANESIFATAARMVANLRQPFGAASDKARVFTENNQILDQLDSGLGNLLDFQAQVGARLNQLDVAEKVNTDLIDISKETKSRLEDADLESLAVEYQLQITYLQIAQKTFASLQGLSAFNFI